MADTKKIQLNEVLDGCSKAKSISRDLVDETKKMGQLLNMQALESNAPYLVELGNVHRDATKDIESVAEYITDVFKAVQKDAELTVKNATSLKTTMV